MGGGLNCFKLPLVYLMCGSRQLTAGEVEEVYLPERYDTLTHRSSPRRVCEGSGEELQERITNQGVSVHLSESLHKIYIQFNVFYF